MGRTQAQPPYVVFQPVAQERGHWAMRSYVFIVSPHVHAFFHHYIASASSIWKHMTSCPAACCPLRSDEGASGA